jgi:hypothetical protein
MRTRWVEGTAFRGSRSSGMVVDLKSTFHRAVEVYSKASGGKSLRADCGVCSAAYLFTNLKGTSVTLRCEPLIQILGHVQTRACYNFILVADKTKTKKRKPLASF